MSRRRLLQTCMAFASLLIAGCGYTFGPSGRPDVRTVHVPVFRNETFRRNIDYLLTEAVQQEIKSRGAYRLADEASAETVLQGTIIDARKIPLSETRFDDPREVQIMLAARIAWIDRRTGQILQQRVFQLPQSLTEQSSDVSFAPEVGHSMATAQTDAVQRLAGRIVDLTEMPW